MIDIPVSPLRRRMIEDMTICKFAPKTRASYIRAVRNFTVFLGRSPDQASARICGAISCVWPPPA
jgi:integrase/recombinase XerD